MAHTTEGQEFRDYLVSGGWDQLHADICANAYERYTSRDGEHLAVEEDFLRMDMLVQSILDEEEK